MALVSRNAFRIQPASASRGLNDTLPSPTHQLHQGRSIQGPG
jgi:hypothetical protein